MDYGRIYEYRFRDVDQGSRQRVWNQIGPHVHELMGAPNVVLDPAAGHCEFVNSIPQAERWVVDSVEHPADVDSSVKCIVSDIFDADLPQEYFDGVFVSNFLEHLPTNEHVATFLEKMHGCVSAGGSIAVLGPNFRYCARHYFDFADHSLPMSHLAVVEHLYAARFDPVLVVPRYLPISFRGRFPASATLARLYLKLPLMWRVLGKQFLIVARKSSE